jgi:hypothetical protein
MDGCLMYCRLSTTGTGCGPELSGATELGRSTPEAALDSPAAGVVLPDSCLTMTRPGGGGTDVGLSPESCTACIAGAAVPLSGASGGRPVLLRSGSCEEGTAAPPVLLVLLVPPMVLLAGVLLGTAAVTMEAPPADV